EDRRGAAGGSQTRRPHPHHGRARRHVDRIRARSGGETGIVILNLVQDPLRRPHRPSKGWMLKQVQHDEVNRTMAKPGTVIGWKLPSNERERLLRRFMPRYENVIADHVTLRVGAGSLPRMPDAQIVGRADDRKSLECLVVELDGTTNRPDGSTYHITWSLGPGRRAIESNDVLRDRGWEP